MKKSQLLEIANSVGLCARKSWTKNKIREAISKAVTDLTYIINHHERLKNSYLWTPPASASSRRAEERRNSFVRNVGYLRFTSSVDCSCKNYYYQGMFEYQEQSKNLRIAKKMLKILTEAKK